MAETTNIKKYPLEILDWIYNNTLFSKKTGPTFFLVHESVT